MSIPNVIEAAAAAVIEELHDGTMAGAEVICRKFGVDMDDLRAHWCAGERAHVEEMLEEDRR